jgi:16S rRNA (guanine1207-N2)-methyltransferase
MNSKPVNPYMEIREFSVHLGKELIEAITVPGLPDWDLASAPLKLLADHASLGQTDSVLLYGCHQGVLGAYFARILPKTHLIITDINSTALEVSRLTLEANHTLNVNILTDVDIPEELNGKIDVVLIQIPKGRQLSRRWLVQAYNALAVGGNLYLAGSNKAGIQSVIKDTQGLYGSGKILAYKKGNRVAHFTKKASHEPGPDWADAPGITPHTWVKFFISLSNQTFQIHSLPGVFSYDHLDEGTEMLLRISKIPPDAKVLDVGCGYGIIGLFAAANGAGLVHLTDNNLLAVAACRETLDQNHITNAQVFAGDLLDPIASNKYDLILSNPPFHTGHAVDYQITQAMIGQSFQALNPGGQLIIVANRFIRYDRLIQYIFGNNTILAESGKFHVLSGLKSS